MAPKKKPAARRAAKQSAPQVNRTKSAPKNEEQTETSGSGEMTTTEEYRPVHEPLEASRVDQDEVDRKRESDRDAQRDEHNRRVIGDRV